MFAFDRGVGYKLVQGEPLNSGPRNLASRNYRNISLSYSIDIFTDNYFVLSQCTRLTDAWTDRQTDREKGDSNSSLNTESNLRDAVSFCRSKSKVEVKCYRTVIVFSVHNAHYSYAIHQLLISTVFSFFADTQGQTPLKTVPASPAFHDGWSLEHI